MFSGEPAVYEEQQPWQASTDKPCGSNREQHGEGENREKGEGAKYIETHRYEEKQNVIIALYIQRCFKMNKNSSYIIHSL